MGVLRSLVWLLLAPASGGAPPASSTHRSDKPLALEQLEARCVLDGQGWAVLLENLEIDTDRYAQEHFLVGFESGTDIDSSRAGEIYSKTRLGQRLSQNASVYRVELESGMDLESALQAYRSHSSVLFVQRDYEVFVETIPADSAFEQTWHLHNTGQTGGVPDADIDAPAAWDVTTGDGTTVVAVIDTGVDYTHPDLAQNIWVNAGEIPNNGLDDDRNGYVDDVHGYDFVNRDADPMDDDGHGTHVAGTIAAAGNNSHGVAGINWNAQIMSLKFLNERGSGSISDAIEALYYAVDNGARISNNSWGGAGDSPALQAALEYAAEHHHIVVAAAGNLGLDTDGIPHYPASYDLANVVSVAATDHNDRLARFSNYGSQSVDLAAPGVSILSTVPGGGYDWYDGTSMAAPQVSGVLSLVWELNPSFTDAQVIRQVLGTVDPVAELEGRTVTGGRLNAARAVSSQEISPAPDDPVGHLRDATGIRVGDSVSVVLQDPGDQHWYAFQAHAGLRYIFETELGTLSDTTLTLYSSDGTNVLEYNDDGGPRLASRISWSAQRDGIYYLKVQAFRRYQTGGYTLHARVVDDYAHNFASATSVPVGTTIAGVLENVGDRDVFSFQADAGVTYAIQMDLGTLTQTGLTLHDQNGVNVFDADDDFLEAVSHRIWTAPADGTYFLQVGANTSPHTGTYQVTIRLLDDHGNAGSQATVVEAEGLVEGIIEVGGDEDWFAIQVSAGLTYVWETVLGTLYDTTLTLYDQDGTTLVETDDDGGPALASQIQWTADRDGIYFLKVQAFREFQTGTYSLQSDVLDDHGQDAARATAMTLGQTLHGIIELAGDRDWFALSAEAGQSYLLETGLGTLYDTTLTLYDQDGTTILAFNDDGGPALASRIPWTASETGLYFLEVGAYRADQTGSYTLSGSTLSRGEPSGQTPRGQLPQPPFGQPERTNPHHFIRSVTDEFPALRLLQVASERLANQLSIPLTSVSTRPVVWHTPWQWNSTQPITTGDLQRVSALGHSDSAARSSRFPLSFREDRITSGQFQQIDQLLEELFS